ncbi:Phosphatidylinositol transfer protein 3-like protein [Drosera capensis]
MEVSKELIVPIKDSDDKLPGSSEEERQKIKIMRASVEEEDPSSKDVDDMTIRRFLRARNHDIEKASTMFLNYLSWKRTFIPRDGFSPSQIPNQLAMNKMFMQGHDKQGRPIIVGLGARAKPVKGNESVEEFKRFIVYCMEKVSSRIPKGEDKFVVIVDMDGWGYSNLDMKAHHAVAPIMEAYYPERAGKVFVTHPPYIFMLAWKLLQPLVDENTKKKIVFVENKKLKSTLLEDIDESQLPDIYGGKLPLVPIQDS